jgi:hypothetical protein
MLTDRTAEIEVFVLCRKMFVAQIVLDACYLTGQGFKPTLSQFIKYLPSLKLSALDSNPTTNLSTVSKYLCHVIVFFC